MASYGPWLLPVTAHRFAGVEGGRQACPLLPNTLFSPSSGVWLYAPFEERQRRVQLRDQSARRDSSDVDAQVLAKLSQKEPDLQGEPDWRRYDASGAPAEVVVRIAADLL